MRAELKDALLHKTRMPVTRFLAWLFFGGLATLAIWSCYSEFNLSESTWGWQLLSEFNLVQDRHLEVQSGARPYGPKASTIQLSLVPGKLSDVEMSWSAGSKTYCYLRASIDSRVIFDFWGTNSIVRHPEVWVEPARSGIAAKILTYQPSVIPDDTPLGDVVPGFVIWTYQGSAYRPHPVEMCPLNTFMRNPLPFQD